MPGHQNIACIDCHQPAGGSFRQQVQAALRAIMWRENNDVDFGASEVNNNDCNSCHYNRYDRHATYRFLEPRFARERRILAPHQCRSCHRVHSGKRVSIKLDFCQHCHQKLNISNDATRPTHVELISSRSWNRCLSCHDYHGNHIMDPPTNLNQAINVDTLIQYADGGGSPYTKEVLVQAKESR